MVEISIGLGIILSLVLSEALGVTAGGIIVPGYIALFLHQPIQVLSTFSVAIIVLIIIKLLSRVMFLYGKRRIVLALILGFFFGYLSRISRLKHYSPETTVHVFSIDEKAEIVSKSILDLPDDTLIYAIGNQVGVGQEILELLSRKRSNG